MKIYNVIRKLDDRNGEFTVKVHCNNCDRTRDFAPHELVKRIGRVITLDELQELFRCSQCGSKHCVVWADSDAPWIVS